MGFVVLWQGGIKKGDEVPDGTLGRLAPVPLISKTGHQKKVFRLLKEVPI